MEFGIKNIEVARERINNSIIKTPLIRVENLDEHLGFEVYLNFQH